MDDHWVRYATAAAEARPVTKAAPALGEADPFAGTDGLTYLRRLAQEAGKPKPSGLRGLQRRRQLHRRQQRAAARLAGLREQPIDSDEPPAHSATWCSATDVNVLLTPDRTCPACKQEI